MSPILFSEHLLAGASLRATNLDKNLAKTLWKRLTESIIKKEIVSLGHLLPPLLLYDPQSVILRLCTYVIADEKLLDADKFGQSKIGVPFWLNFMYLCLIFDGHA